MVGRFANQSDVLLDELMALARDSKQLEAVPSILNRADLERTMENSASTTSAPTTSGIPVFCSHPRAPRRQTLGGQKKSTVRDLHLIGELAILSNSLKAHSVGPKVKDPRKRSDQSCLFLQHTSRTPMGSVCLRSMAWETLGIAGNE